MPLLILHEHPEQSGKCLESIVAYAKRIPIRFSTVEEATLFLRSQPFEFDPGFDRANSLIKDYKYSQCDPWQRQRIWPNAFNCWEATAHWLAHALKLLKGNEIVEIWDRTLSTGVRHIWPTLAREDGIWLVQLEQERKRPNYMRIKAPCHDRAMDAPPANLGWQDVLGALHYAGAGVLGFFLGSDRAAPIVQAAEQAWGSNIADWSKSTQSVTKAGEVIADYAKEKQAEDAKKADSSPKPEHSTNEKTANPKALNGTPSKEAKTDRATTSPKKGTGMNWGDI